MAEFEADIAPVNPSRSRKKLSSHKRKITVYNNSDNDITSKKMSNSDECDLQKLTMQVQKQLQQIAELKNYNKELEEKLKQNKFYELSLGNDEECNDDIADCEFPPLRETQKKTRKAVSTPATSKPKSTQRSKAEDEKPPQLIVHNENTKELHNKIFGAIQNKNYYFNSTQHDTTKIQILNISDYKKVRNLFIQENIKHFTFTPKSDKPLTFILKNFPSYYDEGELISALNSVELNFKVIRVSKFKNNWLVQFENSSDINQILQIKYLNQNKIYFHKYKPNQILQCKRCQRFNHAAINCNMPYRCVKCGGNHGPNKCPIPSKDLNNDIITKTLSDGSIKKQVGIPVYCVLCKSEGHTANYRNCEVYQKLKQNLINRKLERENNKLFVKKSVQNFRSPTKSYSDALRVNNNNENNYHNNNNIVFNNKNNNNNNNTNLAFINNECQNVFGQSFSNIIFQINTFLPTYDKEAPIHVKQEKLFNLFFSICSGGNP